ncbi:ABC transporter ATP-binding protein [Rhizobium sp. RU36D]|uniref:ABC transporter ATP-binding protein n=1 Tax=Rhizobium sp. RU36D TaxID=1907415 RepID=UPI0009D9108A|nr:ABC transporter ATP-binding protein [Rhizobium sp. RU36D]SMC97978.1 nucleoside ABC transporter ATP-binding protein [Rhizobium sp. RU36D]
MGASTMGDVPIISFEGVSKHYPNGTQALSGVSFSIAAGAIHAICGENGAGKSTLMKILFGLEQPTGGAIRLDGEAVSIASPRVAASLGIAMVHQHFSLIPSLSVAENILLGQEPRRGLFIDRAEARRRVLALSARYHLEVDPDARISGLSVAAQQKVEILKALLRDGVRVLILDEPTAVLTPPETDELFERLRDLQRAGLTILFISHKLREVRALCTDVTALRLGQVSGDSAMDRISDAEIAALVMGASRPAAVARSGGKSGAVSLVVEDLHLSAASGADRLTGVNFSIRSGEILGIAGVDGSGQRGLVSVLSGARQPTSGSVTWNGQAVMGLDTIGWRRNGMAHLPADRFHQGGARGLTVTENALAGAHRLARFVRGPFLRKAEMEQRAGEIIEEFGVRCPGPRAPLSALSGGNAQKVIAAREFATDPSFLIADQPTRGIDIAAAAFIQSRILELAASGAAVLLISADLDELLALSDRVAVLYAGRIVATLDNGPDVTPERLGPFMLGLDSAA